MDEVTLELIAALCLRASALLEDRSVELVDTMSNDPKLIERRIFLVEQAGHRCFCYGARSRARSAQER